MVIKDENYIVIHGWMRNKLGLNGNDLIVYAVLYGFSQDGESEFRGTLNYISNFSGSSEATVRRSLHFLEGNGYIKRLNRNLEDGKSNGYVCILLDEMIGVSKCNPPGIKMQPPGYQNATPRVSKCNPYQTLDNKEEYITSDKEDYMKERKKMIYI